jgi:predicted Zn-dependent protease
VKILFGFERSVRAAQGYWELGMHEDALVELSEIDPSHQNRPEVMEMRLVVLLHQKRWREALEIARQLCDATPKAASGFIHCAFCLHELGETREAKRVLLDGPQALLKEPTYHYNLACYECALGNLDAARIHLEASVMMDTRFRDFARNDPDLKALHEPAS